KKVPLDVDQSWVLDGADGTRALDRCSLSAPRARVLEATVRQHRRVLAVRPADAEVVTLQAGAALGIDRLIVDGAAVDPEDICDTPATITATIDRVTLNRTTAAPTGGSEIQYDDQSAAVIVPDRRGYTYLLPFGFTPDSNDYFDPITRQSVPLTVAGTESIGGRTVTHFVATIPETDLSAAVQDPRAVLTKPAAWFRDFPGIAPTDELTATLRHRATIELFVDEATGVIVSERAAVTETYRFTPELRARSRELNDYSLINVDTTLDSDQRTIREAADYAASRAWPVLVTTRVVPIAAGVLGLFLLGFGIWWLRRPDESAPREPTPGTS
ncbi:MAG: DUF3068 domain-containing protein, partial [Gordonia sp. (in: high G+C Gram-positive bacteria)]|uniref:DUF3068 domain-containing protein n=1 Tax=Gordonia sp. (in: high G+C Gram-positive bacteria) TaxID=84139 RepID=UPI003BB5B0E9